MVEGRIAQFVILVVLCVAILSVFPVYAGVPTEPHNADAMWIEPSSESLTVDLQYTVGYRFEVTVCINLTFTCSGWQFKMLYDKSHLNATGCGYTADNRSQFFEDENITTIPVTPVFGSYNATHDYVMHSESWISGPMRTSGYGDLSWVEFEVLMVPPRGPYSELSSMLDISTCYDADTYALDDVGKHAISVYDSTYTITWPGTMVDGRIAQFVIVVVLCAAPLFFIERARRGKVPKIRKLPGLDAIDEAVGRATEMGRPVVASHGIAGYEDYFAPQTAAGMSVLGYVSRLCAKYDTELLVPCRYSALVPVAQEIVQQAYIAEGKPEAYKPDNVMFLSDEQFAYSIGYMGLMTREKVAANIMIGAYWAESLQLAETGFIAGAIQVAGTANYHQIPFFVVCTDYCLIGEEIFAAGAYLSKDPVLTGSLAGQDVGRLITEILIILGTILATAGSTWLVDILSA